MAPYYSYLIISYCVLRFSIGNVSPPHDDLSNETPPSYNQLNYNDNLSRFFNSQPKTLTEKEVNAASGASGGGNSGGGGQMCDHSETTYNTGDEKESMPFGSW